jgi:hypothetical protein
MLNPVIQAKKVSFEIVVFVHNIIHYLHIMICWFGFFLDIYSIKIQHYDSFTESKRLQFL